WRVRARPWSSSGRTRASGPRCGAYPWPSPSDDDVDVFAAAHDLVLAQLQPPVGDALAGLQLVFIAMPRAGEVHLVGKRLSPIGAVRRDDIDDAVDHQPLADRPARMDAKVTVGIVRVVLEEHADLVLAGDHDAAVSILEIGRLGDETFGHLSRLLARLGFRHCSAAS